MGERRIAAVFEGGRQTDEKISAVQYVRFPVDGGVRRALGDRVPVSIAVDHPRYAATAELSGAVRDAIMGGFLDAAKADAALFRVRDGAE